MTARILFRFHKSFDVCIQNLKILRTLNPGFPIDGIYGGEETLTSLPIELTGLFDTIWKIPFDDPYYKWKNGDLCARWWFKDKGRLLDFSHMYFIEWDMLFVKPLSKVYGALKSDCNYAVIFGDCSYAQKIGWYWIREQFGVEVGQMLGKLEKSGRLVNFKDLSFGTMGGCIFSRKFLELYSAESIPSYSNDEVRLSVYSAAYGIPLLDNGIKKNKLNRFTAEEDMGFTENDLDEVIAQGGDVIHPLRLVISSIDEKIRKY